MIKTSLFILLFLLSGCVMPQQFFTQQKNTESLVTRIVDGDTFVIDTGEKVRLICVNTPEIDTPEGIEAKAFMQTILDGKTIRLEKDSSDTDRYGRLLRYAYLNNTDVGVILIQEGYASVMRVAPNTRKCDMYDLLLDFRG